MKIIKVESCKTCPFRKVSHSFLKPSGWSLKCGKSYGKDGFRLKSFHIFDKNHLNFEIPEWCQLEEAKQ